MARSAASRSGVPRQRLAGTRIGFIGAGNMADAMIRGLVQRSGVNPATIVATNRSNHDRLARLEQVYGIRTTREKSDLVAGSDLLVLAVKPRDIPDVLTVVGPMVRRGQVCVSVAAGVPLATLCAALPRVPVLRAMPNLASSVAASVTALATNGGVSPGAHALVRGMFECLGRVVEVSEECMDAITALAGSGPAYVYRMMEAMTEAGARLGLPGDVARLLAEETVFGAAKLVRETGEEPAVLRQRVTSPGGTTMAGLQVLEERGFREALVDAIARAAERARELRMG
ncbi:MAG: pyrroline-5-carboxylate reductase [Armatimonadetes bacterium]|nr:pyrroline-5-carboxylate reductase [Armatimonadota bacterium]